MDFSRKTLLPLLLSPHGTKLTFKLVRDQISTAQGHFTSKSLPSPSSLFFIPKGDAQDTFLCGFFSFQDTFLCGFLHFITNRSRNFTQGPRVTYLQKFRVKKWTAKGFFVLYLTSSGGTMMPQSCLLTVFCSPWAKCQPGTEISRKGADKHCLL